ncbi:hypothetical protein [Paenibacillus sp. R14(2021)]|uniref:hypothetical protein n=1 Tax=Paenibacillus sp. R14(2021) TaxID=2859228 RepID=UPI0035BE7411
MRANYWAKEDFDLGDLTSQYLLHFARSGNPNGDGLPNWTPASGKYDYLDISASSHIQKMNDDRAALWTVYLHAMYP